MLQKFLLHHFYKTYNNFRSVTIKNIYVNLKYDKGVRA